MKSFRYSTVGKHVSFDNFKATSSLSRLGPLTSTLAKAKSASSQQEMESALPQIDLVKYPIAFERIFDDLEAYQLFREFLREKRIENELLFIEAVQFFEYVQEGQRKRKMGVDIYRRFICSDSDQEINLASSARNAIETHFKQIMTDESFPLDKNIFNDAKYSAMLLLKEDPFSIFRKTSTFHAFLSRQPLSYLEELATPKSAREFKRPRHSMASSYKYVLDPLLAPSISDQDICFVLQSVDRLAVQSEFTKICGEPCITYCSNKTYDLGTSETKNMLLIIRTGTVNYQLGDVVNTMFDVSLNRDDAPEKHLPVRVVQSGDMEQGIYSVAVTRRSSVFYSLPLANRDYCVANSVVHDPHKRRVISISKSCLDSSVPVVKGWNRSYTISGLVLQQESDSVTSYTEVIYLNTNWLSRKLLRNVYSKRSREMHAEMVLKLDMNQRRRFPVPKYSSGIFDTLLDFENRFLRKIRVEEECPWDLLYKQVHLL